MDEGTSGVGLDTFERLVDGVRRCLDAGRFSPGDAVDLATQLWAVSHGAVTLELAGLLDSQQALTTFSNCSRALFRAYGDDPRALGRSFTRAGERIIGQAEPVRQRA